MNIEPSTTIACYDVLGARQKRERKWELTTVPFVSALPAECRLFVPPSIRHGVRKNVSTIALSVTAKRPQGFRPYGATVTPAAYLAQDGFCPAELRLGQPVDAALDGVTLL